MNVTKTIEAHPLIPGSTKQIFSLNANKVARDKPLIVIQPEDRHYIAILIELDN